MKLQYSVFALAGILATAGAAQAAQLVVIDTKGSVEKTLPIGSVVDDATLDIPDHDQVTVMNANGDTIRVDGPHKGPVGAPAGGDPGMLQRLSAVMQERHTTLGTTRGPGFKPQKTDPWAINATVDGSTVCVFGDHPAQLWLPNASAATITDEKSGKSAPLSWSGGTAIADWPSALPTVDGDAYSIMVNGKESSITLKMVATAPSEGSGSLLAAAAGCKGQSTDLAGAAAKHAKKAS